MKVTLGSLEEYGAHSSVPNLTLIGQGGWYRSPPKKKNNN